VAAGDLEGAVAAVMDEIRTSPTALAPRLALFQLACITGDWTRASRQLEAIAGLDPETAMLGKVYGSLIAGEAERHAVLTGRTTPVCLGQPPSWLAMLAQALPAEVQGNPGAAAELRARALEDAEPSTGTIDGNEFTWLMDADPRFGPVLEAFVNGEYRWVPLSHLKEVRLDQPKDFKDLVWLPGRLVLSTGSEVHAFLPVRYPRSESSSDPKVRMARATLWEDVAHGVQHGMGQRVLASDAGDHPLLDVRHIVLVRPSG
jgi:type VI secretion system protein ImpE